MLGRSKSEREPVARKATGSRALVEAIVVAVVALAAAVLIQQFVIKPYKIPSLSMAPTLIEGQRVLVNRLGAHFTSPKLGHVIVFRPPAGADRADASLQCGQPKPITQACGVATPERSEQTFIKRVVGLPGDRIALEGGHVVRNGQKMPEPYAQSCPLPQCNLSEVTVPQDAYYLLGDNRDASGDSRFWGPVSADDVIGRAVATYWPIDRVGGVGVQ